jgi:hypothetical protein
VDPKGRLFRPGDHHWQGRGLAIDGDVQRAFPNELQARVHHLGGLLVEGERCGSGGQ